MSIVDRSWAHDPDCPLQPRLQEAEQTALQLTAENVQLAERIADLEAVLLYCRDNLEWEKKFRGNNYTLALEAIRVLLGDPGPEPGSQFRKVLEISKRGEKR